jgi:hypothetical protein
MDPERRPEPGWPELIEGSNGAIQRAGEFAIPPQHELLTKQADELLAITVASIRTAKR